MKDLFSRYIGVLALLGECSVYVPEDIRQMIEEAFQDGCAADEDLSYRRILDRIEIDFQFHRGQP